MVRAKCLSEDGAALIRHLYNLGTERKERNVIQGILQQLKNRCSRRTIYRVLKEDYTARKPLKNLVRDCHNKSGQKNSISVKGSRYLHYCIRNRNRIRQRVTIRLLRKDLNFKQSRETIRRWCLQSPYITRRRPKRLPLNLPHIRKRRVTWAQQATHTDWSQILFYDEKRFCRAGPDRPMATYRDCRIIQPSPIMLHSGGGSVNLLLCIGKSGFTHWEIFEGSVCTDDILHFFSSPNVPRETVMMDNAKCHQSSFYRLRRVDYTLHPQPAYSPDVQPVENVFKVLSEQLYQDNVQFSSLSVLTGELDRLLRRMCESGEDAILCAKLVKSMPRRVQKTIEAKGGHFKRH